MKLLFTLIFLFLAFEIFAQEPVQNAFIESLIEEMAASNGQEMDVDELYDDLVGFMDNPLDLNTATREDLAKFQFLNETQVNSLIQYIAQFGPMLTIYELQLIDGFDEETLRFLTPFVIALPQNLSGKWNLKNAVKYGKHQLIMRSQRVLETQQGFRGEFDSLRPNAHYLGDPFRHYLKYSFDYKKNLQFGFTADKDAGEEFFKGSNKQGFDYYSAFAMVQNVGKLRKLIIGDFNLQFGQGLTFWSGFGGGKSSYVLNTCKKAQGIRKYSSTDENAFLRGTAATVKLGDFRLTGFYSRKKIDANIDLSDSLWSESLDFTTLVVTGLHSTPGEIADEKILTETVTGGNFEFRKNNLKTGISLVHYGYDKIFNKELKPYNRYEFRGKQNTNLGFDYQYNYHNFHFFGEAAMSANGAKAILSGLEAELHQQVQISILYRNFDKDYQALYASAFSENSKPANEKGFYIGTQIYPYKHWKLSGYFDTYRFPWLKYRVNGPSSGHDAMVQAEYSPTRRLNFLVRYRQHDKQQNSSLATENIHSLTDVKKTNLRFQANITVNKAISLSNRIEMVHYQKEKTDETGYIFYQDVDLRPTRLPIVLQLRYTIFDTPSYNSAVWVYENDVLYGYSVPALYDEGSRFYAVLKYSPSKTFSIWLRYSQTRYSNKQVISSGLTLIDGNLKSEVKVQVKINF